MDHGARNIYKKRLENAKARVTSMTTVADRKAKSPTTPVYRTLIIEVWWWRVNESARHSDNTAAVSQRRSVLCFTDHELFEK